MTNEIAHITGNQYQKAVEMVRSYEVSPENQDILKDTSFYSYVYVFKEDPNFNLEQFARDCNCVELTLEERTKWEKSKSFDPS
jgi:hypothetical protein